MVLFKRKPVTYIPQPDGIPDGAEIWSISATDEVFVDYEKFLKRMEFLTQKKFTDAVNGKSGLTFFAALASESKSSSAIENVFPEVLRDPILRKVQFSTVGRMDDLVNMIFDDFKRDFFPGEEVIALSDSGDASPGVIREKAKFPMIRGPDGSVQREAFSRYFVRLSQSPHDEALVDDKHVRRDRKIFTKQNLRAFLKNSLQREAWTGAPWLVKEHLAIQYRLPMEIPAHLLQDAKLLQNKVQQPTSQRLDPKNNIMLKVYADLLQQQMLQTKPPKGRRPKIFTAEEIARLPVAEVQLQQMQRQPQQVTQHPIQSNGVQAYQQPIASRQEAKPPPVVKYPIEDLDIAPKQNGVARPGLNFLTTEMADYVKNDRAHPPKGLQFETLGGLLEVWNTLNVLREVYLLDGFTFDDFVDAMSISSVGMECELVSEVFCAVLKVLINEDGVPGIELPNIDESESESSEDDDDNSELSISANEAPAHSTRQKRLVSHVEVTKQTSVAPASSLSMKHRAPAILADFDWQQNLGARNMEDGFWQLSLLGALERLSHAPQHRDRLEPILIHLAPLNRSTTHTEVIDNFQTLDVNLRATALQILTIQSVFTRAVKNFLETCTEDQTDVRKQKMELQRERRSLVDECNIKDRERKILLPENMPDSPVSETIEAAAVEIDIDDTQHTNGTSSPRSDDDDGRALRRHSDRKRKREEQLARTKEQKAEEAAAEKARNQKLNQFQKLLQEIKKLRQKITNIDAKISACDDDLRVANVQRTKVLGTDRFCNRYYWFERNGQPFGGDPNSSTAHYGYINGCIWVQGPEDTEREGYIDLPPDLQAEYKARFRMTLPERRKQEEGSTILQNMHEWGYYDDPDRLDSLIAWLDERGQREKLLCREVKEWREEIVKCMSARKRFFDEEAAKKLEADEEQATRVNTRHAVQSTRTAAAERCMKWHNSSAIAQQKHLHCENPPKPKSRRKPGDKGVAQVVLTNRSGKPLTRQGANHGYR